MWWYELGWPTLASVLTVVVLIIVGAFLWSARRYTWSLGLFALTTLVLRGAFEVNLWDWLEWLAFLLWIVGVIALLVYLSTGRFFGLATGAIFGSFGMVLGFVLWEYVLFPVGEWVAISLQDNAVLANVLWGLIVVAFIVAVILFLRELLVPAMIAALVMVLCLGFVFTTGHWTDILDVFDHNQQVDTATTENTDEPVVAVFSYAAHALEVQFDASPSTVPEGHVLSYSWDFGDGQNGEGLNPTHVYDDAGAYNVTVTVTDDETDQETASAISTVTVQSASVKVKKVGLNKHQIKSVAKDLNKIYKGFDAGQVKVGDDKIPHSKREAASASFSGKTIKTQAQLSEFLHSGAHKAKMARQRIRHALRSAGYDKAEVKRALSSGDHWLWVAPTVASQISGTTFPVKGKVVKENGYRGVAPNDAIWFYVTSDGHVVTNASLRADCMNPEVTTVTPIPQGSTPPPISCISNCVPQEHGGPPVHHGCSYYGTCPQPPTHGCTSNCSPTPPQCVKPPMPGGGTYKWDSTRCTWYKPQKSDPGAYSDKEQNQGPHVQNAKDNSTSGSNTGPTEGAASSAPSNTEPKPVQNSSSPAPDQTDQGSNSGSSDGSGAPSGSTSDSGGTSTAPTPAPTSDPSEGADNTGGDSSTKPTVG